MDASKIYYCLLGSKKLEETIELKRISLVLLEGSGYAKLVLKEAAHHHLLNYLVSLC